MAISGSCLCGGVRFEIEKAVGPVEICHCNRCRKTTGSASLPAIGVMTEDYRFLAGHELVKTYEAPILYEPPAYQSMFCSNCGGILHRTASKSNQFETLSEGESTGNVQRCVFAKTQPRSCCQIRITAPLRHESAPAGD